MDADSALGRVPVLLLDASLAVGSNVNDSAGLKKLGNPPCWISSAGAAAAVEVSAGSAKVAGKKSSVIPGKIVLMSITYRRRIFGESHINQSSLRLALIGVKHHAVVRLVLWFETIFLFLFCCFEEIYSEKLKEQRSGKAFKIHGNHIACYSTTTTRNLAVLLTNLSGKQHQLVFASAWRYLERSTLDVRFRQEQLRLHLAMTLSAKRIPQTF